MEPRDYFEEVKSKLKTTEVSSIEQQLLVLAEELERASEIGLSNAKNRLAFAFDAFTREQVLVARGYDKYVHLEDIMHLVDAVSPKNSIKIIELNRYPRIVPEGPAKKVKELLDLKVFSDMFVVYTDYTNEKIETPAEREEVKRNTDPIIFGTFNDSKLGFRHDRYYFVADWEDEYCDLTFDRMIEKMSETLGEKEYAHSIGDVDFDSVNRMVKESLETARREVDPPVQPIHKVESTPSPRVEDRKKMSIKTIQVVAAITVGINFLVMVLSTSFRWPHLVTVSGISLTSLVMLILLIKLVNSRYEEL